MQASDTMMNGSVPMILAMWLWCLPVAILPALAVAAPVNYLRFSNPARKHEDSFDD